MREIHLEERPTSFKQVVGQREACEQLIALGKSDEGIPHCLLFTGPSGCGKTTLARIVRKKIRCSDSDFMEVNAADSRGIDMVRSIQARVGLAPLEGDARVWLIDECHQLTGDAQGAFLKLLEEPPDHVYFMLATTNPQKLRKTIRTRCTEIKVRDLTETELMGLASKITKERTGIELSGVVARKLAEVAEGSARKALVLLQQIIGIKDDMAKINALQNADAKQAAIEIARAIMSGKPWKTVVDIIKNCDEEPESIRWMILGYFTTVALGGGKPSERAIAVMEEFQDNYFDTKKAGLVMSCYRACSL
ncbi:AAA family ATPase [Patescibacteria group bacterium]|nr:AAA family ATPase [Patescibacteria group bacterium]